VQHVFGYATLEPGEDVVAGGHGTWRLTYIVSSKGIAPGGSIRLYTDSDTDWGIPQFIDPAAEDYATVSAPGGVHIVALTQGFGALLLVVEGRSLRPGERVALVLGDRSGGSIGSRAQTFVEPAHYFAIAVDVEGDGQLVDLANPPCVAIVGGLAVELVAVTPSTVVAGQAFRLLVKAQDAWGNPASSYRGTVEIAARGVEIPVERCTFAADDGGVHWIDGCRCLSLGVHRIHVAEVAGPLRAQSNPMVCVAEAGPYALYWGDPHGGQLEMATKIPDFFRYARDIAGIDFCGYQPNGHRVSTADWTIQQQAEREFYEPGQFVTLPGFEWSGEPRDGGHHNVYFRRHDQPIRRSCHLPNIADQPDHDTDLLHILNVYQAYRFTDTVITPHVGGGRADLSYHDPTLEPAIEVTSTHGTFEWFLRDALKRGYKVGFIGGSDGYTGRPGAEFPGHQERRYAKGGYTGLYANELTVEGILAALKARRGYGTTGARIYINVNGDGHVMGEEYTTSAPPTISAMVIGTAPLESVELYRGLERVYSYPLERGFAANKVRILWEGASRRTSYSGVIWDGLLRVRNGAIALQELIRFDSPRSRVFDANSEGLRWHSVTCGYRSGIILDVSGDAELCLVVNTSLITRPSYGGFGDRAPKRMSYSPAESVSLRIDVRELTYGPREVEIGPLDRRLTISLAPESETDEVAFSFTDPSPRPGTNPYWLRVTQADMEMAWTSPVFVDYALALDKPAN